MTISTTLVSLSPGNHVRRIKAADLNWLVGLLEGEGCFTHNKVRNGLNVRVSVNMTDLDVVLRVQAIVGTGSVRYTRPARDVHSVQYRWYIFNDHARQLMRVIKSRMGARRRARIDGLLAIYPYRRDHRRVKHYLQTYTSTRNALKARPN